MAASAFPSLYCFLADTQTICKNALSEISLHANLSDF